MKQTAMKEHIEWLYEVIDIAHSQNMNKDVIQAIEYVIEGAKAKLPLEKEQMENAVSNAISKADMVDNRGYFNFDKWYNETYHSVDTNEMITDTPTCPKCSAYDWSYWVSIDKMKCGDCGYIS